MCFQNEIFNCRNDLCALICCTTSAYRFNNKGTLVLPLYQDIFYIKFYLYIFSCVPFLFRFFFYFLLRFTKKPAVFHTKYFRGLCAIPYSFWSSIITATKVHFIQFFDELHRNGWLLQYLALPGCFYG